MECSICSTPFASRGQAPCASCVRATIYQARLNHLTDLLARESSRESVSRVVTARSQIQSTPSPTGPELVDIAESTAKHKHAREVDQVEDLEKRCECVDQQLSLLRKEIDDAREVQAARRLGYEHRRANLKSEKMLLQTRMSQSVEPTQTNIKQLHRKLDKVHSRARDGRVKLCHETARLAGLQQRKRKTSHGHIVDEYLIGGVPIPDLRHLHTAKPDQATAALANICRLLTTSCHYLSVRLPAEITPAHANYPHPTIFSVQSSYQGFQLPFPGATNPHQVPQGPSASRLLETRSLPKLRLLHLGKPLVRLAREDPVMYNLFVEGVTLLAWNVAWLCRSQGLTITNSFDDVCAMGKNLCALFSRHAASIGVVPVSSDQERPFPSPAFGDLSHAAIQMNLEGPVGIVHMRNWRVTSPHRIIDSVKKHLLAEISGDEWDLIAESEWDNERDDEQPVLVGGTRPSDIGKPIVAVPAEADPYDEGSKGRGSNGWMKLKSRE